MCVYVVFSHHHPGCDAGLKSSLRLAFCLVWVWVLSVSKGRFYSPDLQAHARAYSGLRPGVAIGRWKRRRPAGGPGLSGPYASARLGPRRRRPAPPVLPQSGASAVARRGARQRGGANWEASGFRSGERGRMARTTRASAASKGAIVPSPNSTRRQPWVENGSLHDRRPAAFQRTSRAVGRHGSRRTGGTAAAGTLRLVGRDPGPPRWLRPDPRRSARTRRAPVATHPSQARRHRRPPPPAWLGRRKWSPGRRLYFTRKFRRLLRDYSTDLPLLGPQRCRNLNLRFEKEEGGAGGSTFHL